jgi:hypothetical protein
MVDIILSLLQKSGTTGAPRPRLTDLSRAAEIRGAARLNFSSLLYALFWVGFDHPEEIFFAARTRWASIEESSKIIAQNLFGWLLEKQCLLKLLTC